MRRLERVEKPAILATKESEWTAGHKARLAKKAGQRPDDSKYGHPEIVAALRRMSGSKCFYCETPLVASELGVLPPGAEVDHFVECAEAPDLAFAWENLYLACKACNAKKPNKTIPVVLCVDPCADEDPAEHLTFKAEYIHARSRPGDGVSAKGQKTIEKYNLKRGELLHPKLTVLRELDVLIARLEERKRIEQRAELTDEERALLLYFLQPDQPFQLMARVRLAPFKLEPSPPKGPFPP